MVWRSVLAKWQAKTEAINKHDLVIEMASNPPRAVIEMKLWLNVTGLGNIITSIKSDIAKLKGSSAKYRGLMIFSANPLGQTEQNVRDLEKFIFVDGPPLTQVDYRFPTIDPKGADVEFWISLWEVG